MSRGATIPVGVGFNPVERRWVMVHALESLRGAPGSREHAEFSLLSRLVRFPDLAFRGLMAPQCELPPGHRGARAKAGYCLGRRFGYALAAGPGGARVPRPPTDALTVLVGGDDVIYLARWMSGMGPQHAAFPEGHRVWAMFEEQVQAPRPTAGASAVAGEQVLDEALAGLVDFDRP